MKNTEGELLPLGRVVGIHGLKGDLKVRVHSADPTALRAAVRVFLSRPGGEPAPHRVEQAVWHKAHLLLRLEGCRRAEDAQALVGYEVLLPAEELPELADDEFYWRELQGMTVIDRQRGELGTLQEIFNTAAHDIYVVQGRFGEILIPVVDEFILEVDVEQRRMLVELPEGLIGAEA